MPTSVRHSYVPSCSLQESRPALYLYSADGTTERETQQKRPQSCRQRMENLDTQCHSSSLKSHFIEVIERERNKKTEKMNKIVHLRSYAVRWVTCSCSLVKLSQKSFSRLCTCRCIRIIDDWQRFLWNSCSRPRQWRLVSSHSVNDNSA